MRWRAKRYPNHGDRTTVRRFAYLPTRVGDKWIWLEAFYVLYHYDISAGAIVAGAYGWQELDRTMQP